MMPSCFKLLRVLSVAFLFGILNFLTAGLGACLWHLIEFHGDAPEMFGWRGLFLIVGWLCIIFNSGVLIVSCIFTVLSKASSRWIFMFASIEAISFGIIFLFSAYIFEGIENDLVALIIFWVLFSVLSIIGWMMGNRLKKPVNPVNPVKNTICENQC